MKQHNTVKPGSSYWRCSVRKGALRKFEKFRGKHLFLKIPESENI